MLFLSAVADAFDGWLAYYFNVHGELGKQLDTLADCLSFGVAPAMMTSALLHSTLVLAMVVPMAYLISVVIRLAKYNVGSSYSRDTFCGMPSPMAALVVSSFMGLTIQSSPGIQSWLMTCLPIIILFLSYCMLSSWPFPRHLPLPFFLTRLPHLWKVIILTFLGIALVVLGSYYFFFVATVYLFYYLLQTFVCTFLSSKAVH